MDVTIVARIAVKVTPKRMRDVVLRRLKVPTRPELNLEAGGHARPKPKPKPKPNWAVGASSTSSVFE